MFFFRIVVTYGLINDWNWIKQTRMKFHGPEKSSCWNINSFVVPTQWFSVIIKWIQQDCSLHEVLHINTNDLSELGSYPFIETKKYVPPIEGDFIFLVTNYSDSRCHGDAIFFIEIHKSFRPVRSFFVMFLILAFAFPPQNDCLLKCNVYLDTGLIKSAKQIFNHLVLNCVLEGFEI